jgi:hypothetical protein
MLSESDEDTSSISSLEDREITEPSSLKANLWTLDLSGSKDELGSGELSFDPSSDEGETVSSWENATMPIEGPPLYLDFETIDWIKDAHFDRVSRELLDREVVCLHFYFFC